MINSVTRIAGVVITLSVTGYSADSWSVETVHVSSPPQNGNLYFSTDTNAWSQQEYSAGCSAISPVAHPDGSRIYTANACIFSAGLLTIFDITVEPPVKLASLRQTGSIWGIDINADGSKVYLADFKGNQLAIIDTATNAFDTPVAVSDGPYGIKLTPDGQRAWLTHFSAGTISIVNLATGKVEGTPVSSGPGAAQIAFSKDGNTAFITNSKSNTVTVMNTANPQAGGFKSLQVGSEPNGIEVMPNGAKAYVAVKSANQVAVISTLPDSCLVATEEPPCISQLIDVGTKPQDVAITADGTRVYVSNSGSESMSIIDTGSDTVAATVTLDTTPDSQPYGIAISGVPGTDFIFGNGFE